MLLVILKEEIFWNLLRKRIANKLNQKEFRVGKVRRRKSDKLHIKWKDYDSSFNSWIDKKDIV